MSTTNDPTPKVSAEFTGEAMIAPADGTGPPQSVKITGRADLTSHVPPKAGGPPWLEIAAKAGVVVALGGEEIHAYRTQALEDSCEQ